MDEMNGAFEEKKRRKGGKRLMQPEKAAKAPKAPHAEKPPRVPRETSGKTGKVVGIVAVSSRPVEVEFVDAVPIAVEKRLESCGIPVVGKGDELLVGEYDVVAYLHSPGERLNLRSAAIHASYSGEQRS